MGKYNPRDHLENTVEEAVFEEPVEVEEEPAAPTLGLAESGASVLVDDSGIRSYDESGNIVEEIRIDGGEE